MTGCQRLLQILNDGKPHSHTELYQLGLIVHSRVADLRRQGHNITCTRQRTHYDGYRPRYEYFYRLHPEPLEAGEAQGCVTAPCSPPRGGTTAASPASSGSPADSLSGEPLVLFEVERKPAWA